MFFPVWDLLRTSQPYCSALLLRTFRANMALTWVDYGFGQKGVQAIFLAYFQRQNERFT